jgi:site-specific DNA-methyltransferase (adenine-specific)
VSDPTPYYADDWATIYHGDCEAVLPTLGSFSLAITSPPYNMGLVPGGNGRGMYRPGAAVKGGRFRDGYGTHGDALPQQEYDQWQRRVLGLLWDHVNLALFYNHRPRVEHGKLRLPLSMDFGSLPAPRQIIVWDRGTGIDVTLRAFCTRQEWIILFARPEFNLVDHAASGMGDVWRLGMETTETGHPAPFPLSLPTRCIAAVDDVVSVLDPFMGSGTTLRAAKDAGVRAVGIDIEERYCEIAARRLSQEVFDFGASA